MTDQVTTRTDAQTDLQQEAARLGALPAAPLAMPRQRLEHASLRTRMARLRALIAPRADA